MQKLILLGASTLLSILISSCKKFMDAPTDSNIKIPTTLQDCQALLDNDRVMNGFGNFGFPYMPVVGSDEYYISDDQYNKYSPTDQQASIWARQIPSGTVFPDWNLPYQVILTSNAALQTLSNLSHEDQSAVNNAKGKAHFYRAFAYYQLSQVFAPVYDSSTAMRDLGVPLRQSTDEKEKISRATVQETYDQILSDLEAARSLLQQDPDWLPTRPSLTAVYALSARLYLSASNYKMALRYADSCLQLNAALMSFDTISTTLLFPFQRWNTEVIFDAAYYSSGPAAPYRSHVDSILFQSYQPNDRRKDLYFKLGDYFSGSFDQEGYRFAGLSTSEMYLTRSECFARAGNISAAMADLNHLLQTRWVKGTFIPYTAADANDALQKILQERRKELLFRGTRWTDLRRLNRDPHTATTLTRFVNGVTYTLPPQDPRWVFPIPDYVLYFNPQMPQNSR